MRKLKLYAECDNGAVFDLAEEECQRVRRFYLNSSKFASTKSICITSESFKMKAGDEGYYLVPGDEKASGTALIRFKELCENEKINVDNPSLSFFAVADKDATNVVMIENNYLYNLIAEYEDGTYRIYVKVTTSAQPVADDFALRVMTLPSGADYNDVAKAVRNYRLELGEIKPLADKCREREILEYARLHPLVRVRMGWKPVPPDILSQNPENEPPMHVACTFADVRALADKMKRRGIKGAEISLVGWNAKGHAAGAEPASARWQMA